MAVRRPLKINGSDLQEMSDEEIGEIQSRMISLFAENPSVTLSVVGAGGNLGSISDKRTIAGPNVETGGVTELSFNTINFSRINQSVDSAVTQYLDTDNRAYPVYYTDSGDIKSMNDSDFIDTFISPAVDTLTSSSLTRSQGGTYFIASTNLVENADLVSSIPVFVDTLADEDAFSSGPLSEEQDQFITVNSYYLHKLKRETSVSSPNFLLIDSDYNIRQMNDSDNDVLLQTYMQWAAVHSDDCKIRYSYDSGNNRGTAMIDTILDSDNSIIREGEYLITDYDYEYGYQRVPSGSPIINEIYYLKINKV